MAVLSGIGMLVLLAVLGLLCGNGENQTLQQESQADIDERNYESLIEEISSDENDHGYWDPPGDDIV